MLDIAPEFAQEAEAIMIRKAVERGHFQDAHTLARRARMRSIHYQQFIDDRLFQAGRAADRIVWSRDVLPQLDEARAHLGDRQRHETAIIESIREHIPHARGDVIVIQDADLEYVPEELPKLVEPILSGEAGVVYGNRFSRGMHKGHPLPNRIVNRLLSWAVLPLYFGFFLLWEPPPTDPARALPFLKPRTRDSVVRLTNDFVRILTVFFRAQLVVALLQGLLVAIGFTLVGLDYGFVIGLTLGVLTIIPYLGTAVGFVIAVPLAWIQADGGPGLAALTAGVLVAVQLIEGWFLTPRLMGDRTGLHWMAIIVAVLFWGSALGGLTGALLAIPLTAFAASAWRLVRERYVVEMV